MVDLTSNKEDNGNVSGGNFGWGKKVVAIVGGIVVLVGIFVFFKWMHYRNTHAVTNNAFVQTDMLELSPLVPGHLKQLLVDEGDRVKKGQLVAQIDDRDYQAKVAMTQAQKEEAVSHVDKARISLLRMEKESARVISIAKRGIVEATEILKKVEANQERIAKDYLRYEKLVENRVVSQRLFDTIEAEFKAADADKKVAETGVRVREEELLRAELTKLQVEEARKSIATLMAVCETAGKSLDLAKLNLDHTNLKSPIDGVIAKKNFDEGDYIAPGFPVFNTYNEENVYIEANLEETKTKGVKIGLSVDVWVDAYPGEKLRGEVINVGMAAGREFALIPRDVSAGEFTKIVQRIPIKIKVPPADTYILKPGMSAKVGIELD